MKRVVTVAGIHSEHADDAARCLKRANSSPLFSVATFADEERISARNSEATAPTPLLVDDGAAGGADAFSPLKLKTSASGLFPLDGSDDEGPAPAAFAASSCSSELEGQDDVSEASRDGEDAAEDAPAPRVMSAPCPMGAACEEEVPDSSNHDQLTGLVFEAGSQHFDRHNRFHKERPVRITSVRDHLAKAKPASHEKTLFERCRVLEQRGRGACIQVGQKKSPEELWLDDDDYLRVHLPGYMQRLDKLSACNCHHRLDSEAAQFESIYFTNESVHAAKAAASSLCRLVARVVSGGLDNGFAVIRPPGHHAEPGVAGGYCVINNVAVAAAYAREKLGLKKVLIVDWDVHHGNGTQRCFIDDPSILYFSAHRHHGGHFFPFLPGGGPTSAGRGPGAGRNVNVGWNEKGMGDDEYLVLWERLLMPVALEFEPDLVLVSAGFDAARGDMGECDVTPACFARLTRRLKGLARGRVVCALEGGYVRSVLCRCVESVVAALLDADSDARCRDELRTFHGNVGGHDMLECINSSAAKSIRDAMAVHAKYWDCLKTDGGDV